MNKQEYIQYYCNNSGMTLEQYNKDFVALDCHCDYVNCRGWVTIENDELAIKTHMELYVQELIE